MNYLWVLVYKIGEIEIFLTPSNAHSTDVLDALKFQTEDSALKYRDSHNIFLTFQPEYKEIIFKERLF